MNRKLLAVIMVLALLLCGCSSSGGNNKPEEPKVQDIFFEEAPTLLNPESFGKEVSRTGKTTSSSNGVVTKIEYRFTANEKTAEIYNSYRDRIAQGGFTIQKITDEEFSVIENNMKIASVTLNKNQITVDIIPEDFRVASVVKNIDVTSTQELDFAVFTFKKMEITKKVYPDDSKGVCLYWDEVKDHQYITLRGKIKNTSAVDLSSRYIMAVITINNKYKYECSVVFGANPKAMTDYAIAPFEESPLYISASVPTEAINQMTDGLMTISFNNEFNRGGSEYEFTYNLVIPH